MSPASKRVWLEGADDASNPAGGAAGRGGRGGRRERPPELATLIRQDARGCLARLGNGDEVWCSVRGKVHLEGNPANTTPVAVGDRVHVRRTGGDRGSVVDVCPRTSVLSRPDPHHEKRQLLLAANVDQVVAVASAAEPSFAPGLVDRVLLAAEWSRLKALLVINKRDRVASEPEEAAVYRRLGYAVLFASATTGEGIAEVRAALAGRTSVVTGHSGVGKTSLLNAVEPGLGLKVGLVNAVSGRGTHTTTAAVLFELGPPLGGAVVDTPGIREFGLYNVPRRELTWLFRDLAAVSPRCKFKDCLHKTEPGCAIAAAVESGEVAAWRYDSYLRLLETTLDLMPWQIPGGNARTASGAGPRPPVRDSEP